MLVRERMTKSVITVSRDTPIMDALNLMKDKHIRRLPVVDTSGRLQGIVSERDLLHAAPSQATSLSVWELNYLLSRVTVAQVMTKQVITVAEDTPIEEAARIMADNKIGGLPVVRDDRVTGIITETDVFKVFLELLGARSSGVRLMVLVRNMPGELARLTKAIFDAGGNIIALATSLAGNTEMAEITLKVSGVDSQKLTAAVGPTVQKILDVRQS
jgi:acetoin utilization protein AcuB